MPERTAPTTARLEVALGADLCSLTCVDDKIVTLAVFRSSDDLCLLTRVDDGKAEGS